MHRKRGWWKAMRSLMIAAVTLLVLGGLSGCQTHDDAIAASQQMAETAQTMQRYYATLDALLVQTEEAQRAQGYLSGIPFDTGTEAQLEETRAEIGKRAKLAQDLVVLSSSFAEITDSAAANDAATAAGALNDQLVSLKVGLSSETAAKALKIAVTSLVNAIRAHDEVKAAKILSPVTAALCTFYDSEKAMYVSVANSFYGTAASNANALIAQDQVSTGARYRSSLEPFGLEADIQSVDLRKAARGDLKAQVTARLADRRQESAQAADALGEALHRMQARIDTVARGNPMRVRLPPLQVESVKAWIATVQAETGVGL